MDILELHKNISRICTTIFSEATGRPDHFVLHTALQHVLGNSFQGGGDYLLEFWFSKLILLMDILGLHKNISPIRTNISSEANGRPHSFLSCTYCCIMYWVSVYRTAVVICFSLVPNLLFLWTSCGFTKIFPELTRPSLPIVLVILFFFCCADSILHFSFSAIFKSELLLVQIYAAHAC